MQIILFYVVFMLSTIPMFSTGKCESISLLLLHIILTLISSISLFSYKNRPYSLFKIVHLFFLFFICIAPYFQFQQNIVLWGGKSFTEYDYLYTSFVFLCIILFYNLIYYIIDKQSACRSVKNFSMKIASPIVVDKLLSKKEFMAFFFLSLSIFLIVIYACDFNLFYLFFRGGISDEESQILDTFESNIPQSINLIIVNFLKPMAVVLFLSAYKLKANKIQLIILCILMLLSAFPTSMPRFSAAAMYIPVMLTFFSLLRKPNVFVFVFVFGLLVIFPFLNNFRYLTSKTEIELGLNFEMFLEGHFDAYSSFMRILVNDIITYGEQFLGCIFFWVPRSIWSSKPIGSGAFLSNELDLSLTNISCCYFAEGYINWGILGILLFTVFIAVYTSMFDKVYWEMTKLQRKNYFFEVLYFLLLGLTFFILRGDLLSSYAYTIGFACSVYFVYYLLYYKRKYVFKLNM